MESKVFEGVIQHSLKTKSAFNFIYGALVDVVFDVPECVADEQKVQEQSKGNFLF